MTIVTWNVNSVRAREARLLAWLAAKQPDVVCLQELKGTDATFPFQAVAFQVPGHFVEAGHEFRDFAAQAIVGTGIVLG